VIADVRGLRPALPILIGTAVMLSLSMGILQIFGLFLQPITKDLALSVSDFTTPSANAPPRARRSRSPMPIPDPDPDRNTIGQPLLRRTAHAY
jgi:hypothetical protein